MNVMNCYACAKKLYLMRVPVIPKLIKIMMRILYSCEIPYTANIHNSVKFPHNGLGVVIGHDAVIEEEATILQNVTIGGIKGIRANPTIGKRVLIGAGACVLGGVKIGDDAKIGANAVVLCDVPSRCTAVGIPAKIVKS